MPNLAWNLLNCYVVLQLQVLQMRGGDDDSPRLEVFQRFGSPLNSSPNVFEYLLSKRELWFEESESSCQRTIEKTKYEERKEKARIMLLWCVFILRYALLFIGKWFSIVAEK